MGRKLRLFKYASTEVKERARIVAVYIEVDLRIEQWCCGSVQLSARKARRGEVTKRQLLEDAIYDLCRTVRKGRHLDEADLNDGGDETMKLRGCAVEQTLR